MNTQRIDSYFDESSEVIALLKNEIPTVKKLAEEIYQCHLNGGKVLIAGNGGSCADSGILPVSYCVHLTIEKEMY